MSVSESDDEPMPDASVGDAHDVVEERDGSVEDTEEEEEDAPNYEDDGFVVNEEEAVISEGANSDDTDSLSDSQKRRKKRRKKIKQKDLRYDEEDFSWLAENNAATGRGRGGRRLKKESLEMAARLDLPQNRNAQNFEDLEDFQDDEMEDVRAGPSYGNESDVQYSDGNAEDLEMDDFIVDEVADRRRNQQRRRRHGRAMSAAYQEALQEVAEIFGDAEDLIAMYLDERKKRRAARERSMNPESLGREAAAGPDFASQLHPSRARRSLDMYDPEALAMHCLLPKDDEIRRQDVPERFQERIKEGPAIFDYDAAAEWIYNCLFDLAANTPESELVENGQLEIDGPSEADDYCAKNAEAPCKGHRVVRPIRTNEQKKTWRTSLEAQTQLKKSIATVLKHVYEDDEEIPYIATYRKPSCGELLCLASDEIPDWTTQEDYNLKKADGSVPIPPGAVQAKGMKMKRWQVLWAIYELSLKWRRLQLRIEKRVQAFAESLSEGSDGAEVVYAVAKCSDQMSEATSTEEADLAERRYRLVMSALKKKIPDTGMGTDSKVQRYCTYKDMAYRTIVEGLGLRTSFGLNELTDQGDAPDIPACFTTNLDELIMDVMQENKGVVGEDAVLMGARHMAAMELATHPRVRSLARKLYGQHATVTTTPTELGEKVLDPFHVYGYVKRLVNKPIRTFKGDMFLRIICASEKTYIKYSMEIPDRAFEEEILPTLTTELLTTGNGPLFEGWESFRREIIEHLAKEHLFPALQAEYMRILKEKAKSCVLSKIFESLWKFVIQGPFKPAIDESNYEEQDSMVRVCACCWGQGGKGQPSTVLVMLDSHGELRDMIELKQFSGFFDPPRNQETFNPPDVLQDEQKREDAERVRDFLMEHKPHVVVVGGAHMVCRQLVADLELIRDHFLTDFSRFMVSIQGNMEVLLLSEMIPAVWENSPAAKTELPDHSAHVRRAVALGRCLIDPLSVVASLRDHFDTILSVIFNDLQEKIIKEERLAIIDQAMVTAMNQLGGELNLMANVQWRAHALQFVAGLGRRKAQGLLHLIQRNANGLESRGDLMTHEQLGPTVLKNAIGFLIVNDSELPGMANVEFDLLDETRIHVEHYSLAKEMAMLAAGTQHPDAALAELAEKPDQIESLDLDWFNKQGMEHGRGNLLSILIDLKMEIFMPFCDRRPEFSKPNELEVFLLLLNEKAETMKPGKLVEAVVQQVDENEILCSLVQSRLKGTIKKDQFSSTEDPQSIDLRYRVRRDDIIRARLIGIEYKDFLVELSCRSADLENDERWEHEYCTDEHYHVKTEEEKEQERVARESKQQKTLPTRRIDHPLFKNVSEAECVELLSKSPPGYAILRPSNEGYHYITLSFNGFSGRRGDIYLHRDLKESPKGATKGMHTKLGLPLMMMLTSSRCAKFDDLEEVVSCFVDPYVDRVKALKMHRKFRDGSDQEVEQFVREDKRRVGPKQAAYCLAVDYQKPGWFYIAFILNSSLRKDYFSIVPDGYYFRKQVFRTPEAMIDEFKAHPQPPMMAQPQRPPMDPPRQHDHSRGRAPGGAMPPAGSSSRRKPESPGSDDDLHF